MRRHMRCAVVLALVAAAALTGCMGPVKNAQAAAVSEIYIQTVTESDPEGAAEAIYETLEDRSVERLTMKGVQDILDVESAQYEEFAAYYSNAKNGLCDVVFIKAKEATRDKVREQLYAYKDKRVEEFRNYDILDAFSIAQNAVVYDQGEYVVLLMLPDNEAAQEIIDDYIPQ